MSKSTIGVGLALILVGLIGFFGSGMAHKTALIPALFGILFLVLGVLARKPGLRKHMMHVAVVLALLGAVGPAMRMRKGLAGEDFEFSLAFASQAVTALLCAGFVVAAVFSFIAARRAASANG